MELHVKCCCCSSTLSRRSDRQVGFSVHAVESDAGKREKSDSCSLKPEVAKVVLSRNAIVVARLGIYCLPQAPTP